MGLKQILKSAVNAPLGIFSLRVASTKHLEPNKANQDFLEHLSGKIDCVLYVGANQGQYFDILRESFTDAHIYLYEPDPELVVKLKGKIKGQKNFTIRQVAVGENPGKSTFYTTSFKTNGRLSSSLLKMTAKHEEWALNSKQIASIPVEVIKLDDEDFAQYSSILLKIDVQGFELQALRGGIKLLKNKIVAIDTEVSFQELYHGETNWLDLNVFLEKNGFAVFGIDPWGKYYKSHSELLQADMFFLRKDLF